MSACAKSMGNGDIGWSCQDCNIDENAIFCRQCFENGNHEGHRTILHNNTGGFCDCGEPKYIKESGFCS